MNDFFFVLLEVTESCFRHPLSTYEELEKLKLDTLTSTFLAKKVTSKSRKVEVFGHTIVKKLSTFRPHISLEKQKLESTNFNFSR